MFQRIAVPLDGSARAERAVPVAARLARASHATMLLVCVVNAGAYIGVAFAPAENPLQGEQDAAMAYLREVAQRTDLQGVSVSTAVARGASVAAAILDQVTADTCDLIVLCSHGRTGLERWALGGVAEKLARHSPVPVLILRATGPVPAHPHPDAERPFCALLPLDGSPLAEAALVPAARLVAALAAPATGALHLLQVIDPTYLGAERGERMPMDRDTREAIREDARSYLRAIAQRLTAGDLAALGLQVTWSVREDWDVAATICQVAEGGEDVAGTGIFGRCDVIAMATHGRGGWQRWMLGSVTERVLHAARLPLLAIRPQGPDDTAQVRFAGKAAAGDTVDPAPDVASVP